MNRPTLVTAAALVAGSLLVLLRADAGEGPSVSFHKDVRPILQRRCAGCHQPASRAGKFSVVTYAHVKSGGTAGPGFVSGKPEDSPLYRMVSGRTPTMPKDAPPLTAREVETIRSWVAQGGRDDTPEPRDTITQENPPVYTHAPVVTALAFSPDGEMLAVNGFREVVLYKADGSERLGRLVGRSQRIESIAFSPDGKTLAAVGGTSCKFGEVQLWGVEQRKLIKSVEVGFDVLYGVSFAPTGKHVASGGAEKSAYLYSVPDLEQVMKFDNHSDWVFGTTFSKDSKNFITTSRDRATKLIEIATKNFVDDINYQVYNGGYYALARNPQSDDVAVGGEEGIVRYYSIFKKAARNINRDDFNLLRTYDKVDGPIYALTFSPDGAMLAVAGRFGEVRIYRTSDGTKLAGLTGHTGSVHSLAWNPKRPELAVGGFDGTVRIYKVPEGQMVKSFLSVPVALRVTRK